MKEIKTKIGDIGNYYGGLNVKKTKEGYFWSIENYDGDWWSEIPKHLYDALISYEEERTRTSPPQH